ncbi:MAG: hypothetical protein EZS28_024863 [Streblomastix strix]|uniref:Uncharacterized protein n=1 Tax=Streblomastix strix TaxID=222440 RepID=A0A5J4VAI2_9EUKA|nr:MAG: hypothetical protein EZS28_024863 [Streblomastix strix]
MCDWMSNSRRELLTTNKRRKKAKSISEKMILYKDAPMAPLLISRTDTTITLLPVDPAQDPEVFQRKKYNNNNSTTNSISSEYTSNQVIIPSQVPVFRLVIFGKKSDSATGLTINSTMLNGTCIPVTPYEPNTITGLQPNQQYIFGLARIDYNGMFISYTVATSILEDSQQQGNSSAKSLVVQMEEVEIFFESKTVQIVKYYPLPVVSPLSQFATSARRCGKLVGKAERFRVMHSVSVGDSPDLARLECIGPDERNTQVTVYLMKIITYRHKLDFELCSTLPKGSVAGAGECGAVIGMFDGKRSIQGIQSRSGMQTLSGQDAGGLEETEAKLLSEAGMCVGASIDETLR